jgi:zinc-finger of a C2HC-type
VHDVFVFPPLLQLNLVVLFLSLSLSLSHSLCLHPSRPLFLSQMADGVDLSTLPPPPASQAPDDRTPCPHCGRKFNQSAADRHIPKCAEKNRRRR